MSTVSEVGIHQFMAMLRIFEHRFVDEERAASAIERNAWDELRSLVERSFAGIGVQKLEDLRLVEERVARALDEFLLEIELRCPRKLLGVVEFFEALLDVPNLVSYLTGLGKYVPLSSLGRCVARCTDRSCVETCVKSSAIARISSLSIEEMKLENLAELKLSLLRKFFEEVRNVVPNDIVLNYVATYVAFEILDIATKNENGGKVLASVWGIEPRVEAIVSRLGIWSRTGIESVESYWNALKSDPSRASLMRITLIARNVVKPMRFFEDLATLLLSILLAIPLQLQIARLAYATTSMGWRP